MGRKILLVEDDRETAGYLAKGLTQDERFAKMIFAVRLLAEQARSSIERGSI